jgi:hypothetical protein
VDLLELMRAGALVARPVGVAAVHQHEQGREQRDHGEAREQDRHARDEAELLDPLELGQHEDQERAARGERAHRHRRPGPGGGQLEGLDEVAPEEDLLLVAEQDVDPVVDADPDHDRDEHDREDREVAHDEGGDAHRPHEADVQHDEEQ